MTPEQLKQAKQIIRAVAFVAGYTPQDLYERTHRYRKSHARQVAGMIIEDRMPDLQKIGIARLLYPQSQDNRRSIDDGRKSMLAGCRYRSRLYREASELLDSGKPIPRPEETGVDCLRRVINVACFLCGVYPKDLPSWRRTKDIMAARQVIAAILRDHYGLALPEIAECIRGRKGGHSSVIVHLQRHRQQIESGYTVTIGRERVTIAELEARVRERLGLEVK